MTPLPAPPGSTLARLGAAFLLAFSLASSTAADEFETKRIVGPGVLDRPVFAASPPGDTLRLFIVEQHTGEIRILNLATRTVNATPFLTIENLSRGNEQGLLGLAFHPLYESNGLFFVYYTEPGNGSVLARFERSNDPDLSDPSETPVLSFPQPQKNHNGGWIGFGPVDDFLYVATGDGGSGNDSGSGHEPGGNAQSLEANLLGKILRLDIDGDDFPADAGRNYAIPVSNPFAGETLGLDEIWSYGLRNPFRASFDSQTGDLYIGDVGQNQREEIDLQPSLIGGTNYGWRLREGTIATPVVGGDRPPGAVDPIFDYAHAADGCSGSVTGGYVYRGPISELQGRYFFADYCTGKLWSLRFDGSLPADFDGTNYIDLSDLALDARFQPDSGTLGSISSFAVDDIGNLYIIRLGSVAGNALIPNTGEIFRVPEPGAGWQRTVALLLVAIVAHARSRSARHTAAISR